MFYQLSSQYSCLPRDFGPLYASICWQALWRCWFPFPAGLKHLPTLPKSLPSGFLTMILLCLIGQPTCLTWIHMESMVYFQEKDEKQSIQSRRAEGSIVPQQCHGRTASMPHLPDAVICVKGAPIKYRVHTLTYFKELEFFCFANTYFLLILGNILNIFWDTGFLTFMSYKP